MRVFKDRNAERRFFELYDKLPEDKQKRIGQMVRDLAEQKMNSDGDEFYVTKKDIGSIYACITSPIEGVRYQSGFFEIPQLSKWRRR